MSDDSGKEIKRLQATATGRVQGVGFRWYVIEHANPLGLSGYVKNLRDGNVEVVAEGKREDLQALVEALWEGPSWSEVRHVHLNWLPPVGMTGGFRVEY